MNHYIGVGIFFVIFLHTAFGFMHNVERGRAPLCSLPNKPCRIRASLDQIGGPETNGAETCTCSPPYRCSEDWSDRQRVVSRQLVATSVNMTFQMMFCRVVEPIRLCRRPEIAIELQSSMMLPEDIRAYHCRCRRRKALILARSYIGEDYMIYHSYKCANHVQTCPAEARCLTMDEVSTEYHCKCPEGLRCRTQDMVGYCMP